MAWSGSQVWGFWFIIRYPGWDGILCMAGSQWQSNTAYLMAKEQKGKKSLGFHSPLLGMVSSDLRTFYKVLPLKGFSS